MIVLDTHIWVWWVANSERLTLSQRKHIQEHQSSGLGVSIISCWEVAKLVEKGKLVLSYSVEEWLDQAIDYPGVKLLNMTIPIVVQSTQLPGFHKDPAGQIITATAMVEQCPLLTADSKMLNYPSCSTLS
ncbi:MAG: type II toxin-antitoxin system VapC family toxin [Cyanobacteria bacterium P01_E01_bin.34]